MSAMTTDRFAIVCDAPFRHEYRIAGHLEPHRISGTYDETAGMVVLDRLREAPQAEQRGRTLCTGSPELGRHS
jgi:hypothetical protein